MGGLSNFRGVYDFFPEKGYRVIIPELPVYDLPLLKTTVKDIAVHLDKFFTSNHLEDVILLGNSLGGHIALLYTKLYPQKVRGLVITGSSGLYENAMGESYPKRGDYNYIKTKSEEVFYDPKVATKEIVDEVYETVNDRNKLIKTLAIAKSAIRHNMAKDLPKMEIPTAIIWGAQDCVTPPNVAEEFNRLLPNSTLYWIDKCGHAPMMEHPDSFNTLMDSWLTQHNFYSPSMQITTASFVISNTSVEQCPKDTRPDFAFIGRSNVGKSSLINSLCNKKNLAKTSSRPGKTQLINHFLINEKWHLVDLPGYGYARVSKSQKKIFQSFVTSYFEKRKQLINAFLLIDIRHEPQPIDLKFMEWLGENQIPFTIVFTKADKLKPKAQDRNIAHY